MPRFYEIEWLSVLYGLDTMGAQERALVERLFEAFAKHPRPADCVAIREERKGHKSEREVRKEMWRLKWKPTVTRDRKREAWRRKWWNPVRDDIIRFLRENGHTFRRGRPVLWLEDVYDNEAEDANEDRLFLVYDILVGMQDVIDCNIEDKEEYPEFWPLPVVELTDEEAEGRYIGGVARGKVV